MACEELQANLDNMIAAYDLAVAESQQAQWAEQAALGAVLMAWWMLEECLNSQNGMRSARRMQKAFSSTEALRAEITEMRKAQKKLKSDK